MKRGSYVWQVSGELVLTGLAAALVLHGRMRGRLHGVPFTVQRHAFLATLVDVANDFSGVVDQKKLPVAKVLLIQLQRE